MRILLKNGLVLSMINDKVEKKDILVEDKKIIKIEENINDENAEIIDCSNTLLMPGFKNAHAHSPMVFARSTEEGHELGEWLNNCIFPMERNLTPEIVYKLTKLAILEYLANGITATCEMYMYPEMMAKAYLEMGFKSALSGYIESGDKAIDEMANYFETLNNLDKGSIKYYISAHAEYTLDDGRNKRTIELVEKYRSPFVTHSSESPSEVEGCKERRNGRTPTEFFLDKGWVKYGGIFAHCIHLTNNDRKIMRENNITAVTCPSSNAKLNSGVCDIRKLLDAGVNVAIGTDGAGSNNSLDMFKEMTLIWTFQNIKNHSACAIKPFEILKMATVNGSKALGFEDIDVLAPGKFADIIGINLKLPNMQPIFNIPANLVYSGSNSNVRLTMINGKLLYKDGQFIGLDVDQIYKDAQEISEFMNKDNIYLNK